MYATPYPISLILFIIDFGTKLYRQIEFRWVPIAPLLKLTCIYTARKEASWILLTMTIKLMLSTSILEHLQTLIYKVSLFSRYAQSNLST